MPALRAIVRTGPMLFSLSCDGTAVSVGKTGTLMEILLHVSAGSVLKRGTVALLVHCKEIEVRDY